MLSSSNAFDLAEGFLMIQNVNRFCSARLNLVHQRPLWTAMQHQ